jgi:hypothetical protein
MPLHSCGGFSPGDICSCETTCTRQPSDLKERPPGDSVAIAKAGTGKCEHREGPKWRFGRIFGAGTAACLAAAAISSITRRSDDDLSSFYAYKATILNADSSKSSDSFRFKSTRTQII